MGKTWSKGLNWLNNTVNKKNLTPGGGLPLPRDYIHVYDHHFQTSSLKPLGQSKPNFMLSLLGKGNRQHQGLKLYKVYINDEPGLTLTYFTARSNWVAYTFEWGKTVTKLFNGENLEQRNKLTE